jgi:hypothetical protein
VTGDKVIRLVTALAVLAVAVIAAIVSYSHIEYLALVNGQTITAARLLPASVDGVVLVSSMVLLDAARRGVPAPGLARVMLAAGVLATLGANSAVGAGHGLVGVLVSGWPAVAFIGCAETFLAMIRVRSQTAPETVPQAGQTVPEAIREAVPVHGSVAVQGVPGRVLEPVSATARALSGNTPRVRGTHRVPEVVFAAELKAGTLPSVRAIKRQCRVGQDRAVVIRDQLAALIQTSAPREIVEVGG